MPCAHDQELEPIQGQRAAQRAGAWPYGVHMTSYRGHVHSPRGDTLCNLKFFLQSGFFNKVLGLELVFWGYFGHYWEILSSF
jgi:hypothetical protein